LRLKGKDEHGMEDLDAATLEAERAKISPEEAMKEIEDDLERLEGKHKGMRKEATRGLEHYRSILMRVPLEGLPFCKYNGPYAGIFETAVGHTRGVRR
jgi:hypothetical protein